MTSSGTDSTASSRRQASTVSACLYLTLALMAAFPAFAGYGYYHAGQTGIWAAALAGLVCWVGASAALAIAGLFTNPQQATVGLLLGMFFRMGLPLGAGFLFSMQGGPLVEAGLLGILVTYYLVALVAETLLSLRFVSPSAPKSKEA